MIGSSVKPNPYPLVAVYAVDWHQYKGQHNPKDGEPYSTMNGWVVGSLIEDTETHLSIAFTVFDSGDAREVVVIPKGCLIHFVHLAPRRLAERLTHTSLKENPCLKKKS